MFSVSAREYLFDLIDKYKIINIYGIAGIGKTYFVNRFAQECEDKTNEAPIYIKFDQIDSLVGLINLIALRINESDAGNKSFQEFRRFVYRKKNVKDSVVVNLFTAYCLSIEKNIILIFEDTDLVNDDVWRRFTGEILEIVMHNKKNEGVKIIAISRKKINWISFWLREEVKSFKLELLTKENTNEMVKNLSGRYQIKKELAELAFENIFRLTIGHPESIRIAVKHWTDKQPLDENQIQEWYGGGIKAIIDEFIKVKILPPLLEKLKKGEHYRFQRNTAFVFAASRLVAGIPTSFAANSTSYLAP